MSRPMMNQSGSFSYKELELLILEHLKATGYIDPTCPTTTNHDQIHIGNMMMDLIMLAENMGLDLTECLAAAYVNKTGKTK